MSVSVCPARTTSPELGTSRPARIPSRVDFPEPEGPVIARLSPERTRRDTLCRIDKVPSALATSLRTARASTTACDMRDSFEFATPEHARGMRVLYPHDKGGSCQKA